MEECYMRILVRAFCRRIAEYATDNCRCLRGGFRCLHKDKISAPVWIYDDVLIQNLPKEMCDKIDAEFKIEAETDGLPLGDTWWVTPYTFYSENRFWFLMEVFTMFPCLSYPVTHEYFGALLRNME